VGARTWSKNDSTGNPGRGAWVAEGPGAGAFVQGCAQLPATCIGVDMLSLNLTESEAMIRISDLNGRMEIMMGHAGSQKRSGWGYGILQLREIFRAVAAVLRGSGASLNTRDDVVRATDESIEFERATKRTSHSCAAVRWSRSNFERLRISSSSAECTRSEQVHDSPGNEAHEESQHPCCTALYHCLGLSPTCRRLDPSTQAGRPRLGRRMPRHPSALLSVTSASHARFAGRADARNEEGAGAYMLG
jgi:hypothetical protein